MKEKFKEEVVLEKAVLADLKKRKPGIFNFSALDEIFIKHSVAITFDGRLPTRSYIKSLVERKKLKEYPFKFPSRKETRYVIGKVSPLAVAQSLKPDAYLTHRSAMFVHGLVDDFPVPVYINVEQSMSHQRDRSLTQEGITRAFKGKVRISNEIAENDGMKVCVLHGQRTEQFAVVETKFEGDTLRITNVARTLIDITVRPIYAGGVTEVLSAYKRAKGLFEVDDLLKTIEKMDYAYPYHQAVGFYLDASGVYTKREVDLFEKKAMEFDFFLTHKMGETKYSDKWRIYYPKMRAC